MRRTLSRVRRVEGQLSVVTRLGYAVFRRLPVVLRRIVIRTFTPHYTVGAVCVFAAGDRVLLLRQRHREGWTLPGGLLDRGEIPEEAVRRELREELALDLDVGVPVTTLVDPEARRVDVIYQVAVGETFSPRPRGEAVEVRWLRQAELDEESELTLDVLALVERATRPGASDSHLLP